MADRQFKVGGTESAPADWVLPDFLELVPKTVFAHYDGSGAAGDFLPCLRIISDAGVLAAEAVSDTKVAAGESADVTWFPGVNRKSDVTPTPVYFLSASLLWGGPSGAEPDVDLTAAGAVGTNFSTAYYQNPGGIGAPALALKQSPGEGAVILGNMLAKVTNPAVWGDTDVFSIVLSAAAGSDFAGTGPYVDAGMSVGSGYIVKPDGSSFSPFSLIVPPLGTYDGGLGSAWAQMYLADGSRVGPTNPWALGVGDVVSCHWVTSVGAWD